jgi:hypothetical protein
MARLAAQVNAKVVKADRRRRNAPGTPNAPESRPHVVDDAAKQTTKKKKTDKARCPLADTLTNPPAEIPADAGMDVDDDVRAAAKLLLEVREISRKKLLERENERAENPSAPTPSRGRVRKRRRVGC